ncbi:MAG: single-stranded-DNA-specific exonuclease RecJ [Patescibacteria group bacterium]
MEAYKIADIPAGPVTDELYEYDPLTRTLLANRGINTGGEAEKFLNPNYERDIHDPFLIKGMDKAVKRIIRGIEKEEKIVIYGDYDCDGIPGSVVLHDFFKRIGYKNFSNYIPHRHNEGYGLNSAAVDFFGKDGVTLLITVDLAIANIDEVAQAQSLGIDVIITDHHLPALSPDGGEILPPAYAVVNSKQSGDTYPDKMLCGAGVAWKLASALLKARGKEWGVAPGWEKWLLDMAGLSTIADMVPLRGENRTIAHYGIKVLRKSPRSGLRKLLRKMRVDQSNLTEDDISFMIAPRINAASRMDIPLEAFRLLSTDDEKVADELSDHLHNLNDSRKELVATMSAEIKNSMSRRELKEVIVIGNPLWRPGLLGILASNLVEEYARPVFVWGRENGVALKGSCRSDGTVNVVEMMAAVTRGFFINAGGHELSGGFSVSHENIHLLEEELIVAYAKVKREIFTPVKSAIDCELVIDDVTAETYKKIERLAPFGLGNPKPVFLFRNAEIKEVGMFGKKGNHLKIIFENSRGGKIPAIGFFMKPLDFKRVPEEGVTVNLVASIEKSFFRNRPELRMRIVDIVQ